MAEMADDDDDTESELRRSIEQNCRVLSRPPVALEVLQTLADTYLAQPPPRSTPRLTLCRALGSQFASVGLRLTVDDQSVLTQSSELEALSDRLWLGRKGGLTYGLERVDSSGGGDDAIRSERLEFWQQWTVAESRAMRTYAETYDRLAPEQRPFRFPEWLRLSDRRTYFAAGLGSLVTSLHKYWRHNELWVAFVTPSAECRTVADVWALGSADVEMAMSVMTTAAEAPCPLVEHMGIQRSFQYAVAGGRQHRRLAVPLHSFAARAMLARRPGLVYFLSAPVTEMRDLLQRALPWHTWEHDRSHCRHQERQQVTSAVDLLPPKPGTIPLRFDRWPVTTQLTVWNTARTRIVFSYHRDTTPRGGGGGNQASIFADIDTEPDDRVVVTPQLGAATWTLRGQSAREQFDWLYHPDLLPTCSYGFVLIVYQALADNF